MDTCGERLVPDPHSIDYGNVVNGSNSNNLTHVLINSLMINGGFFKESIVNKLVYFGTNGVSVFQGVRNGILI
jgi:hypothetical protein